MTNIKMGSLWLFSPVLYQLSYLSLRPGHARTKTPSYRNRPSFVNSWATPFLDETAPGHYYGLIPPNGALFQ